MPRSQAHLYGCTERLSCQPIRDCSVKPDTSAWPGSRPPVTPRREKLKNVFAVIAPPEPFALKPRPGSVHPAVDDYLRLSAAKAVQSCVTRLRNCNVFMQEGRCARTIDNVPRGSSAVPVQEG